MPVVSDLSSTSLDLHSTTPQHIVQYPVDFTTPPDCHDDPVHDYAPNAPRKSLPNPAKRGWRHAHRKPGLNPVRPRLKSARRKQGFNRVSQSTGMSLVALYFGRGS